MSKNAIIGVLAIIITILIGILIITNYDWFSDEWLVGLGMIVASIVGGGLFFYIKLRK